MTDFDIKVDVEPKDNYDKALKLLLETDNAIQELTPQERQNLHLHFQNIKVHTDYISFYNRIFIERKRDGIFGTVF